MVKTELHRRKRRMATGPLGPPKISAAQWDDYRPTTAFFGGGGVGVMGGTRKKASGVRPWLLLDSTGKAVVEEAGKHDIMRRTGLPARDLRILDPLLSYPSTVLGRERAIVVNLEHIKAIITAQEVLLLNAKDPSVTPFAEELQRRIQRHHQATGAAAGGGYNAEWRDLYAVEDSQSHQVFRPNFSEEGVENRDGAKKLLPFEFVGLETCLETACSCLDNEARTLELEAYPALDKLTSKISTRNLERVRQIKSRLVAITGRVQKVRDELEHLLDDDEDMCEMYLTEKLQEHDRDSVSSVNEQNGIGTDDDDEATAAATEADEEAEREQAYLIPSGKANSPLARESHGSGRSSNSSKHLHVGELEMLLEAYFVQIEGTMNKLSTLREYVDDTEDYINIMLDDKQNHLLQVGVTLNTATLVVNAFVVVSGIFGMNITIELFNPELSGMTEFMLTIGGGTAACIFVYVAAIAWYKHRRLLD
ncbi:PREDICTED: magnesium transporter MRS2-3-like isoform X2 [Ipomoea nil]|uniref:magnesium transporter MRS2-3-like n=1 Tax=Ipomoea nil TaxID=35883 RepID=UPI0009012825|nr:PREDICTED: magnesium transporter MRS2-3-like [Ipomoea nil]XP_019198378.1 PREDICTED: magnesium transporter MRS2-3-like isoform X2 [Ipomoea nil]XP_019198500.1 PREDICTED: magnesium transporter MRS2-3-like isoform X2 [Ipomoea nil]